MRTRILRFGQLLWARSQDSVGPAFAWGVWGVMTAATILFIYQYARNVPYMDDFMLVSVMTGHEPVSLRWAWAQHNEHRPVISRLILAGLHRFIDQDFRVGLYFNIGLLSVAAGSMLVLARRLRGYTSVTDAVLPLSILNLGQAENLLISFSLNLVLTAWISLDLISVASLAGRRPAWRLALRFGLLLVLLPLCGGSGLVMLPPLMLWLAAYVAWGWWSGREPSGAARAIGLWFLMACSVVVTLYLSGYSKPPDVPLAPSVAAAASTTVEYLSLVVCPNVPGYWRPAGLIVVLLVAATLLRLAVVGLRAPAERPRAVGLIAVILSMLAVATAVGLSRSGLGPGFGLSGRYIPISAPLLSALYFAWLAYGPAPARRVVHAGLLLLVCLAVPANAEFGMLCGDYKRSVFLQVERSLEAGLPASQLMSQAKPLFPWKPKYVYESFKMLRDARIGKFKDFVDDRVAAVPEASTAVR